MGLFSSVPFTYEQNKMATEVWLYSSFAGAACCALVLLMIGILFLHSESRAQLDRVSFRLLTCSLLANMAFCIASGSIGLVNEDYWGCGASVMLIVLTLHISTFLLFCIALNLYLVIAHKANGHSVEQWYYICSVCIALMLSLPPFLANQYGWDEIIGGCWYSNRRDMAERIRWQVATQLFWSIACSFGEFVGFVTVFMHMLNHHLAFSRAVVPNRGDLHYTVTYRGVIIRIALYPFASLILNCITVACDIHGTVTSNSHSAATANTYRVRLLNDFCYGGRGIVYAALSISDPVVARPSCSNPLQGIFTKALTLEGSTTSYAQARSCRPKRRHSAFHPNHPRSREPFGRRVSSIACCHQA
ncbi:hypothetical protein CYLTODRAFT_53294 [Cylindrobasidium torrendii FP15055 ss-10]|uniref:G-protein coupled receptors family 2 profile 2 domain-containing protein n=1 Tax=Cylindrobasidium torrendii FP15055 ss-10 TaxID=1314674 RepID=A0A0D7B5B3_9AGAR|nr:hypothetical protein CYLTODRAFT_53294 [Cylindrobasidium torrendii FP15055 ss-10]